MKKYRISIAGVGSWGKNYINTIRNIPEIELISILRQQDIRPDFIPEDCKLYTNWEDIKKERPDGVIIAIDNPQVLVNNFLYYKIPVLAEKPILTTWVGIDSLDLMTKKCDNKLLVNYIHLFSAPFQKLKEIVGNNKIIKICSSGFGPSLNRDHFSSLWDYGVHDLSMILTLLNKMPDDVFIRTHNKTKAGESYYINLSFGDIKTKSIVGNGTITKSRFLEVTYESNNRLETITYDDLSEHKLYLNRRPIKLESNKSPLENSIHNFLEMIDGKKDYRFGSDLTSKITKILSTYKEIV